MEAAAQHTKDIIGREFSTPSTGNAVVGAAAFDPVALGLEPDFVLTDFSALKGCGCKLPQAKLLGYLGELANDLKPNETPGMDSSVVKISHGTDLYLVSTTDFFFPSVEDPYVQGKIACANVLSDAYAMGVTEVDTMLMTLGVCRDMSEKQRDVVTTQMIRGFNDLARQAHTNVTGGQTVMNPWPIVGGVAMSVRSERQIIRPQNAAVGDVIVLTKPLGTQVAVNLFQWKKKQERWQRVENVVTREDADVAFQMASESMSRLNLNAAKMMHKYGANSATDVTGFGIVAHARNQAKSQLRDVSFEIHTLPIIKNMAKVNEAIGNSFKLLDGFAAETSGGLLLCLPAENAEAYIQELRELDGKPAWIVGRVVAGSKDAHIVPNPTIIEVTPED
ncbi:Selenide, water dikinase 1 [Phytophthora pseudosyringae]|uniref:Selenide, water dikinase 1 n=1 Tax=Phytophthora pseudosyringae TaxID=221518 RepID=A0A8T1W0C9_9STRA|nr:Selenide, water dikinase 1 [Phytophthora pseudosyringae]